MKYIIALTLLTGGVALAEEQNIEVIGIASTAKTPASTKPMHYRALGRLIHKQARSKRLLFATSKP